MAEKRSPGCDPLAALSIRGFTGEPSVSIGIHEQVFSTILVHQKPIMFSASGVIHLVNSLLCWSILMKNKNKWTMIYGTWNKYNLVVKWNEWIHLKREYMSKKRTTKASVIFFYHYDLNIEIWENLRFFVYDHIIHDLSLLKFRTEKVQQISISRLD